MIDQAHPVKPAPHTQQAAYAWLAREMRRISHEVQANVRELQAMRFKR